MNRFIEGLRHHLDDPSEVREKPILGGIAIVENNPAIAPQ